TNHLTKDDDRFCGDLSLDLPILADREHVIAKLDLAFDSTVDRQVLAAAQLAFDNDAFPNARATFANDEPSSIASLFVHGPLPSLRLIECKKRCRRGFNRFTCRARRRLGSISGEAPALSVPHQMPGSVSIPFCLVPVGSNAGATGCQAHRHAPKRLLLRFLN